MRKKLKVVSIIERDEGEFPLYVHDKIDELVNGFLNEVKKMVITRPVLRASTRWDQPVHKSGRKPELRPSLISQAYESNKARREEYEAQKKVHYTHNEQYDTLWLGLKTIEAGPIFVFITILKKISKYTLKVDRLAALYNTVVSSVPI